MRLFAAVRPAGLSREVLEQAQRDLRRQGRGTFCLVYTSGRLAFRRLVESVR